MVQTYVYTHVRNISKLKFGNSTTIAGYMVCKQEKLGWKLTSRHLEIHLFSSTCSHELYDRYRDACLLVSFHLVCILFGTSIPISLHNLFFSVLVCIILPIKNSMQIKAMLHRKHKHLCYWRPLHVKPFCHCHRPSRGMISCHRVNLVVSYCQIAPGYKM